MADAWQDRKHSVSMPFYEYVCMCVQLKVMQNIIIIIMNEQGALEECSGSEWELGKVQSSLVQLRRGGGTIVLQLHFHVHR